MSQPKKADVSMHSYMSLSVAFQNHGNQSYNFYSHSNQGPLSPKHMPLTILKHKDILGSLFLTVILPSGDGEDCEAQRSNAITNSNWNVYRHISTTLLLWLEFWRFSQASIVKCVTRWDLVFNSSWEYCHVSFSLKQKG